MSAASRELLKELLTEAARLPAAERPALIERVAREAPDVAHELEALLPGLEDSGFLSSPTVACSGAGLWTAAGSAVTQLAAGGAVGGRIGRYKLLAPIGEGGFGVVFMAEQTEPVSRRVALKIIKAGMDTRQVIARFEAERQALALMDHPNIARVFDAGATEQGRPYFVMELVRGEPITKYCDREQLSIERRLELFGDVCRAVQHAHQKGVIHRDLKPSNVLVTVSDSEPLAKVIDFGIAKATASPLTDKTLFTELNQLVGTPEYMSPEQADASSADVDTRSDVYALGVLLYELLTGTTPFDRARLKSAGLQGLIQIIREEEAPRPSQRLATLLRWSSDVRVAERPVAGGSSSLEIARCRRVEPQALERRLRGELDWIVMRCLEKDRRRRYETATALAADVQRYLEGEPVLAAPPSRLYPARKFLRRHRVAAAITIALVGTATIGGGAALVQWQRAESAREAESRQRARAEAVSEFLKDLLTAADPTQAKGAKLTVREALDAAAQRIAANPLGAQPLVEAEIRQTLGSTYLGLGLYAQAEAQLRAADEIQTRELGDEHPDTLRTRARLAEVLSWMTAYARAVPLAESTLAAQTRTLGMEHPDTQETMSILGQLLPWADASRFAEAESLLSSVLDYRRRVFGDDHIHTARAMHLLGEAYTIVGDREKAELLHREALRIHVRDLGAEHPETLECEYALACELVQATRIREAELILRGLVEARRRVQGSDHLGTLGALEMLGAALNAQGLHAEAEPILREKLAALDRTVGPGHQDGVSTRLNLAVCLKGQGQLAETEAVLRDALELSLRNFGPEHADTTIRVMHELAGVLELQHEDAEAERVARQVVEIQRGQDPRPQFWQLAKSMRALSGILRRRGATDEAGALERELLEVAIAAARAPDASARHMNDAAWMLLNPPTGVPREAQLALQFARRANELSGANPVFLDTLALAHRWAGEPARAIEIQKRALELLPSGSAERAAYELRLVEFEQAVAAATQSVADPAEP